MHKNISKLSLQKQVEQIDAYNFSGILLNKELFNNINTFHSTIKELQTIIGLEPLISTDNNLYYFSLKNYKSPYKNPTKVFYNFYEGFYDEENSNGNYWNWCSG